jgi:hypothetical protein
MGMTKPIRYFILTIQSLASLIITAIYGFSVGYYTDGFPISFALLTMLAGGCLVVIWFNVIDKYL